MKKLVLVLSIIFVSNCFSEENVKIIYKYKKRDRIDLGDLEIKGQVLAPGDISITERERKKFYRDLYDRKNFREETRLDILNLR
jgi:hypothetical protein